MTRFAQCHHDGKGPMSKTEKRSFLHPCAYNFTAVVLTIPAHISLLVLYSNTTNKYRHCIMDNKPSWAQNPVQHDPTHLRVSDAELHRRINADAAKEKHGWNHQAEWALASANKPVPIDSTPIPKPMLKKTTQSEAMLKEHTASEEEQKALQARLAAARKGKGDPGEVPVDPTANMTPEQKAKYIADQRLIAVREQTEARELAAWKANQDEVRAIEKERREAAKQKALMQKKEREAQEKKDREKKAEAMKKEQETQRLKEVEHLQQQIAALQAQLGGQDAPSSPGAAQQPAPVASPVVQSPSLKDKHRWAKPGWALPEEQIQQEQGIITDSIQNGLKKPNAGGYERKVFAKQLAPPIAEGKFVRNLSAKKPDPRMVWIVINVNGVKRGKIVMHLYGNAEGIVDKFLELKGLEMERENGMLVCKELTPHFYVSGGKAAQLPKNNPQAVYGVVLEGQDVLKQVQNASADAVISIKQSHIFPVKRAKS
jgi:hypothetical protein